MVIEINRSYMKVELPNPICERLNFLETQKDSGKFVAIDSIRQEWTIELTASGHILTFDHSFYPKGMSEAGITGDYLRDEVDEKGRRQVSAIVYLFTRGACSG